MVTIRKAKQTDIPTLVAFQKNMALETENLHLDGETLTKGIQALFNDPTKGFYNVAELDNKIVGCYMITYEWSDWRNGVVYWLQSLYIEKEFRGQGIFKSIYTQLIDTIDGDHYTVFERMKP
jgi:L-amino acid N-acyltransferase YncA